MLNYNISAHLAEKTSQQNLNNCILIRIMLINFGNITLLFSEFDQWFRFRLKKGLVPSIYMLRKGGFLLPDFKNNEPTVIY